MFFAFLMQSASASIKSEYKMPMITSETPVTDAPDHRFMTFITRITARNAAKI